MDYLSTCVMSAHTHTHKLDSVSLKHNAIRIRKEHNEISFLKHLFSVVLYYLTTAVLYLHISKSDTVSNSAFSASSASKPNDFTSSVAESSAAN